MIAFFVGSIILLLIFSNSKKKKLISKNTSYSKKVKEEVLKIENPIKKLKEIEPVNDYISRIETTITKKDDSIIDVTNQVETIDYNYNLVRYNKNVPLWSHKYIYSHTEIESATIEQRDFYKIFKAKFLNYEYLDLLGNDNYAFILLFDLTTEYDNHNDLIKLENQLVDLGKFYPKTRLYGIKMLLQKIGGNVTVDTTNIVKQESENSYNTLYNDFDYWKLGEKYKTKLSLNNEDVESLNKIWSTSNNFSEIEFCNIEIVKLYLSVINHLKAIYVSNGSSIENEFSSLSDVVARKQYRYRNGSQNYKYALETLNSDFYANIFKRCENTVREYYGHKRKLNTNLNYTNIEVISEYESKIRIHLDSLLQVLKSEIAKPDEVTEIELNSQTTGRWKIKYDEITLNYKNNPNEFLDAIIKLGTLNKKNPSVENLFYEASKFMAKHDSTSSLKLYIYYLYNDLKSAIFDNKQLTKTIQKSLFKTNDQLHDFEQIVSELIKDKNLDKALNAVPKIYEVKRKKIYLDRTTIKDVQQQHAGTVELLNEYLRDEFEDENNSIQSQEINSEEIKIEIIQKKEESHHSAFLIDLPLNPIHISVLELFSKNNFSILQSEIEEFAKSKGVFKNLIIETINEICYEILDDVLIEEDDDDYYTIIPEYFQKISAK